jgi:hypothetical protein
MDGGRKSLPLAPVSWVLNSSVVAEAHWESADRWHSWLADNREEYSRLDRTFAELTELEEEVLSGESISGPQGGRTDR